MRQHYCGLFVQSDGKSDGAICTNDLISVSLNELSGIAYSQNIAQKFFAVERNKRIEVAFVWKGAVGAEQDEIYYKAECKAPYI